MRAVGVEQGEQLAGNERSNGKARRSFGTVWYDIANLKVLKLRQDAVCARIINAPDQLVEPRIGVPATTMVAYLNDPRPDIGYGRTDGYCPRRLDARMWHQSITL